MIRTYAILQISPETYQEIRKLLALADYSCLFHDHEDGEVIDMHGIALQACQRCIEQKEKENG